MHKQLHEKLCNYLFTIHNRELPAISININLYWVHFYSKSLSVSLNMVEQDTQKSI